MRNTNRDHFDMPSAKRVVGGARRRVRLRLLKRINIRNAGSLTPERLAIVHEQWHDTGGAFPEFLNILVTHSVHVDRDVCGNTIFSLYYWLCRTTTAFEQR
jgi:hypothetical protein